MSKRWVLVPGYVYSKTEGEGHFVSAPELAELYGVGLSECYLDSRSMYLESSTDLPRLYPSQTGNYVLPKSKQSTKEEKTEDDSS